MKKYQINDEQLINFVFEENKDIQNKYRSWLLNNWINTILKFENEKWYIFNNNLLQNINISKKIYLDLLIKNKEFFNKFFTKENDWIFWKILWNWDIKFELQNTSLAKLILNQEFDDFVYTEKWKKTLFVLSIFYIEIFNILFEQIKEEIYRKNLIDGRTNLESKKRITWDDLKKMIVLENLELLLINLSFLSYTDFWENIKFLNFKYLQKIIDNNWIEKWINLILKDFYVYWEKLPKFKELFKKLLWDYYQNLNELTKWKYNELLSWKINVNLWDIDKKWLITKMKENLITTIEKFLKYTQKNLNKWFELNWIVNHYENYEDIFKLIEENWIDLEYLLSYSDKLIRWVTINLWDMKKQLAYWKSIEVWEIEDEPEKFNEKYTEKEILELYTEYFKLVWNWLYKTKKYNQYKELNKLVKNFANKFKRTPNWIKYLLKPYSKTPLIYWYYVRLSNNLIQWLKNFIENEYSNFNDYQKWNLKDFFRELYWIYEEIYKMINLIFKEDEYFRNLSWKEILRKETMLNMIKETNNLLGIVINN